MRAGGARGISGHDGDSGRAAVSSVKNADQILVLEDGAAAGIGNHEALMRDCEAYRQIARIQMGGDDHAAA